MKKEIHWTLSCPPFALSYQSGTSSSTRQKFTTSNFETEDVGGVLRGNEKWRSSKTQESSLCYNKAVLTRFTLGNVAFQSFWKLWIHVPSIPLDNRILVYNAMVIPVTLYNCSSWAVSTTVLHTRDACHIHHLLSTLSKR